MLSIHVCENLSEAKPSSRRTTQLRRRLLPSILTWVQGNLLVRSTDTLVYPTIRSIPSPGSRNEDQGVDRGIDARKQQYCTIDIAVALLVQWVTVDRYLSLKV